MRRVLARAALACALACALPAHAQQILSWPANPALDLRIDAAFVALAPLRFPIGALTDVDRRIFVDAAPGGAVARLVIVQFEQVQRGSAFKFVYPPKPPANYGAQTYRFGAYVHDDAAEAARSPDKEAGLTRAVLAASGYTVPRLFRVARLARVADPAGQAEVILFYMENADGAYPAGPLAGADEDGDLDLDPASAHAMLARLKAAVAPVKG